MIKYGANVDEAIDVTEELGAEMVLVLRDNEIVLRYTGSAVSAKRPRFQRWRRGLFM